MGNCLWRFGFAPTLPRARPGRPGLEGCVFGRGGSALEWLKFLDGYLYRGEKCDPDCADMIENVVTTNLNKEARACAFARAEA